MQVYECSALLKASTQFKPISGVSIVDIPTFNEYLATFMPEDTRVETTIDALTDPAELNKLEDGPTAEASFIIAMQIMY